MVDFTRALMIPQTRIWSAFDDDNHQDSYVLLHELHGKSSSIHAIIVVVAVEDVLYRTKQNEHI